MMEESRKQFEAWFSDEVVGMHFKFPSFESGEYTDVEDYDERFYLMLQAMYVAWQASRSAIEIELPMMKAEHSSDQSSFNSGVRMSEKAIRAAGLKIKGE